MVSVKLICVGRLKEKHYIDACLEYEKRLRAYAKVEIIELEEKGELKAEGQEILSRMQRGAYSVVLCIEGAQKSSQQLADGIRELTLKGVSRIEVIIGSSLGLDEAVKSRCERRLSMSLMTFPHHLARVMALEQTYRAFSILAGGKYHK